MQNLHTNITKRRVRQKNREGQVFTYDRYVLHYRDPATGKRTMRRYDTRKEAEVEQNRLIRQAEELARRKTEPPKLKDAVEYWLKSKEGAITPHTLKSYRQMAHDYIIGPAYIGTSDERRRIAMGCKKADKSLFIDMLGGETLIDQITTSEIRQWYKRVHDVSTPYCARVARKHLATIFRMIEEDFDFRLARMPSRLGANYRRKRRELLSEDQVKLLVEEAQRDKKWGVYYAFLLLTAVRPSEMLGLLWKNVDLERGRVYIFGSQTENAELKEFTKTDAGMREIPLNSLLWKMLIDWQKRCPTHDGKLHRVFPAQGNEFHKGRKATAEADGGLTLNNFRMRVWYPTLLRVSLPKVSLYATRHMAISYLQAQGVEVGLVAKIAGHSSPEITLKYYTHAVREDPDVMNNLNAAYGLNETAAAVESGVQTH